MKTLKTETTWIDNIIPEGIPLNSTTLITGPGGSGKPLIGEIFVSEWLKNGGSVIFMSLQYPNKEFIIESIKSVAGINLNDYIKKIKFIQLDVEIPGYKKTNSEVINANLVKPDVWDKVLDIASKDLPNEGPGILIFGSALNLLLFSPTYSDSILEKIKSTITSNIDKTYIFSVSTTAKAEQIAELEKVADNLILSRNEKEPFRLFMKILRMKDVRFKSTEIQVPIPTTTFLHIKEIADHSRKKVIPAILKI